MEIKIVVGDESIKVIYYMDDFPSLCSGIIVHGIGTLDNVAYRKLSKQEKKQFYRSLHEEIVRESCGWEAHYLVCSHNIESSRQGTINFLDLAEVNGYDELPIYDSRVTGNQCQVFGFNITREMKNEYGGDLTEADEDSYYDYDEEEESW